MDDLDNEGGDEMQTIITCKFNQPKNKETLHFFKTKLEATKFKKEMEGIYGDLVNISIEKAKTSLPFEPKSISSSVIPSKS